MSNLTRKIKRAFDADTLKAVCEMHEDQFAETYGLETVRVGQRAPADRYFYRDNGSDILAVAHLDTVVAHAKRTARFVETDAGLVVHSGALDDRLGAYIILHLLPALGITHDVLLTTGEESGRSTAAFFETQKTYNWMIEFDRGGTDVVMYDYDDLDVREMVRESGAKVGLGIFTDICYLEHLEIKGFNWGVGYQDYHSTRGYAYLNDTFMMVGHYLRFHDVWHNIELPHYPERKPWWEDERYEGARIVVDNYDDDPEDQLWESDHEHAHGPDSVLLWDRDKV